MNIALMAHDRKKELMVQFCIAYCGILAEHSLCATHVTGKLVSEATGLPITLYLHADQGGSQQIGARISFNEIDLVLFFCDPANPGGFDQDRASVRPVSDPLCDQRRHGRGPGAGSAARRPRLAQHRQSPAALNCRPSIVFQTAVRMSMACGFAFFTITPKGTSLMAKVTPRTLSGFMELLPRQQLQFERMKDTLRDTYASYGFTPLDTPVIESAEVLLAKGGGETEKQIYRFTKGDSDLALRFDLTVPLAKYVAAHYAELSFPFRRFQIGKVYRGERAQRGRFREFYQADIDVIGDGKLDITNEAEIPAIIYDTFTRLGVRRFQIRVNNRKLLNGFYAMNGMSEKAGEIMRTVDKLDKIGAEKVRQLLIDEVKMLPCKAENVMDFMAIRGTNAEVLASLERYRGMDATFDEGLEELNAVVKYLAAFGVSEENFAVDLTIARGLDYYTGTVYETIMLDHPEIGSVCSGGRYDNLAEYYTDRQLPGVGISIGLTRFFYVLSEQGLLAEESVGASCDALVLPMTEDLSAAIAAAAALRREGLRVQLYTEKKKFKAKMNYADKIGVPYVVFLGEDEIAEGVLSVKDMHSGEQRKLSVSETAALIRADMSARASAALIRE